jgi:hypothetical protein
MNLRSASRQRHSPGLRVHIAVARSSRPFRRTFEPGISWPSRKCATIALLPGATRRCDALGSTLNKRFARTVINWLARVTLPDRGAIRFSLGELT